mgnify:CR=1 FL=1
MLLVEKIKKGLGKSDDYKFKVVSINKKKIYLIYNEVLCSSDSINNFTLKKLLSIKYRNLAKLENVLPEVNIISIKKEEIVNYINKGFLIILCQRIYAIEVKKNLDRGIATVESELSITGPKDAFSENYNTNVGLIRRRIKSSDLVVKSINIGRYTETKVGILYMDSIAPDNLVKKIVADIKKINIDGIIDASYLKNTLENKKNLFPTVTLTERPDKASMSLLEGKIIIITDMSPYAIILPSFLVDFFHTVDDYYQKDFNTTFIRIIRAFAFLIAIFLPALYISITTRNYNLVPMKLLMVLKSGRTFVPFAAYIEALFMIVAFEILKESDIRMSATTGSAVSILGGLILGDAAVSAGIVSPIMIIIIAISSIAGLIFPSNELVNVIRFYKIFILFLSAFFGMYGVVIGLIMLMTKLFSIKSYGYSYLSPFIPFDKREILDSIIKKDSNTKFRNSYLTKNFIRGRYK